MVNKWDMCPQYQCLSHVTHVLVYGCLNQHIHEAYGCKSHMLQYQKTLDNYHCGKCNLQWHATDSYIGKLWNATTP